MPHRLKVLKNTSYRKHRISENQPFTESQLSLNNHRIAACFMVAALFSAAPVFAKDYLVPNPLSPSLTMTGGTQQNISVTYKATANTGAVTVYPVGVTFSIGPSSTASASVLSVSPSPCSFSGRGAECEVAVRLTAPPADANADKNYIVYLTFADTPTNEFRGTNNSVAISITVPKAQPALVETKLELSNTCGVLRGENVTLKAQLTAAGTGVAGKMVQFFVQGASVGFGQTNSFGWAEVTNVSVRLPELPVGDTEIRAVFAGDSAYVGSSDAASLGINYVFQGFMPPMNAEGTSIFKNGRVIPFKIRILDGQGVGQIATAKPEIGVFLQSANPIGTDGETPIQATPDFKNVMRYTNTTDDQYIYNWDLTTLNNGSYLVQVDLNDSMACGGWRPVLYGAMISVEKKK